MTTFRVNSFFGAPWSLHKIGLSLKPTHHSQVKLETHSANTLIHKSICLTVTKLSILVYHFKMTFISFQQTNGSILKNIYKSN